jgi:general secretion pathway protein A
MYKSCFNLTRNPFDLTPDPSFLFPTKRHNEALASLYYGVQRRKGFVVLTGEVGTGKTLLLRCLLQLFKKNRDVSYAYLFNSRLSPTEFLQFVVSDFGLPASGKNKGELLLELCTHVVSRGMKGLTSVLIVDEAHHLSADVLEELRLLTNLETTDSKLLQMILVGQPELDRKLDSFGLRQLKQRIAFRCHLSPLELKETREYVNWRLHLAGANSSSSLLFPEETIAAVHRHSNGLPRLINVICENALISAYARQVRSVTSDIVDEIANSLRLDVTSPTEGEEEVADMDIRRAAKILLDLYASVKKPHLAAESHLRIPVTAGGKHESDI